MDILFAAWKALLIAMLLGAAIGGAFFYLTAPQWDARLALQVGQVAGKAVESPLVAAERVRRDSFLVGILQVLSWPADENARRGRLLRDSIRVTVTDKADLIHVAFRVYDPSDAGQVVAAISDALRRPHDELAGPQLVRLKTDLEEVEGQLKTVESDRASIIESIKKRAASAPGSHFSEQVLISNLLVVTERELREQRERRLKLQEQLSAAMTFPTRPLGGLDISDRPVLPRRGASVAVGALIGLCLGAAFVLITHSRRRSRERV
jgi:hypothetical protein